MTDQNRQHKRIEKTLTLLFCVADAVPQKWDMSVVENISAGGVRFIAPTDLKLQDKIVQLKIRIPALAPHSIELQAMVVEARSRFDTKYSDVRAKFINITDESKERLSVVEKMIQDQEKKDAEK